MPDPCLITHDIATEAFLDAFRHYVGRAARAKYPSPPLPPGLMFRREPSKPGGVRRGADKYRVGKSNLSDYANEHREDIHMPVDVVLQLEHASGVRAVSEHPAFEHDCVLVHLPKDGQNPDWFRHIAGDFLDDGRPAERETTAQLREVNELPAEAASLREALRQHLGDDKARAKAMMGAAPCRR